MRGCVSLMKTGSADAEEREWSEWSIQRRQSARRLKLAEVDGFVVCLAGLSCGRSEVQAAGHFEVEGEFDVGVGSDAGTGHCLWAVELFITETASALPWWTVFCVHICY